jgi:hypothetical protein
VAVPEDPSALGDKAPMHSLRALLLVTFERVFVDALGETAYFVLNIDEEGEGVERHTEPGFNDCLGNMLPF